MISWNGSLSISTVWDGFGLFRSYIPPQKNDFHTSTCSNSLATQPAQFEYIARDTAQARPPQWNKYTVHPATRQPKTIIAGQFSSMRQIHSHADVFFIQIGYTLRQRVVASSTCNIRWKTAVGVHWQETFRTVFRYRGHDSAKKNSSQCDIPRH